MMVKVVEDGLTLIAEEEVEKEMLSKLWNNAFFIVTSCEGYEIKLQSCNGKDCLQLIINEGIKTKELIDIMENCLREISKRIEEIENMFKRAKI